MFALWRQASTLPNPSSSSFTAHSTLLQVLSLFQDNFDYGDIRRDFVHGVLTSDLLMKNIYCYIAKEGYAARVQDTRSYDAIRFVLTTFFCNQLVVIMSHV